VVKDVAKKEEKQGDLQSKAVEAGEKEAVEEVRWLALMFLRGRFILGEPVTARFQACVPASLAELCPCISRRTQALVSCT
jgi:hypothetical protein